MLHYRTVQPSRCLIELSRPISNEWLLSLNCPMTKISNRSQPRISFISYFPCHKRNFSQPDKYPGPTCFTAVKIRYLKSPRVRLSQSDAFNVNPETDGAATRSEGRNTGVFFARPEHSTGFPPAENQQSFVLSDRPVILGFPASVEVNVIDRSSEWRFKPSTRHGARAARMIAGSSGAKPTTFIASGPPFPLAFPPSAAAAVVNGWS